MKKFILTSVLILTITLSFSQKQMTWISLSGRGGFGTSMLINVPSLDDSKIEYSYYSPSYYFGGRFGLMFGDFVGISFEVSMNSVSQNYDVHGITLLHQFIKINTFEFGPHLNLETPTGFYFEIGPNFTSLKNAKLTSTSDIINLTADRTNKFAPQYTNLVFGIGMKPVMTEVFEMKIGIRGAYSFASIVSTPGYIIPADDNLNYVPSYFDEKTNPAQLMASVELTYIFGRFGKANCGKYRFMFNN